MIEGQDIFIQGLSQGQRLGFPNFQFKSGEAIWVSGPSGSGKTAFLKALAGLVPITQGSLSLNGVPWTLNSRKAMALWRRHSGWVSSQPVFDQTGDVRHHIALPLQLRGVASHQIRVKVNQILEELHFFVGRQVTPHQIRTSDALLVALARALVYHPTLLLLDDCLSHLDPIAISHVLTYLQKCQSEGMILILADRNPPQVPFSLTEFPLLKHDDSLV